MILLMFKNAYIDNINAVTLIISDIYFISNLIPPFNQPTLQTIHLAEPLRHANHTRPGHY